MDSTGTYCTDTDECLDDSKCPEGITSWFSVQNNILQIKFNRLSEFGWRLPLRLPGRLRLALLLQPMC